MKIWYAMKKDMRKLNEIGEKKKRLLIFFFNFKENNKC